MEKIRDCLMALEREKIAKGMQCTKQDEVRLKQMQKRQMDEKKSIEQAEHDLDMMWHKALLDDVRRKEHLEQSEVNRRYREMMERRRAYDHQIATTDRKRQELVREERDKENRRLEKMMRKMEQDHYDAIKKKKDQQVTNKMSLIEGMEMKKSRVRNEKQKEREIDQGSIRVALEELRREEERRRMEMEKELQEVEMKDKPFTKKAAMFKDVMAIRYSSSPARTSTNPVHPFKRVMESKLEKAVQLPSIGNRPNLL